MNLVQSNIAAIGTSAAPSLAFAGNTTSGNLIIAVVTWAGASGSIINVRDNINGAVNYTLAKFIQGNGKNVGIYFLNNIVGGVTPTVTATISASESFTGLAIYEFNVGGPVVTVDVSGSNTTGTATTTPTSGPIITTNPSDLIIGGVLGATPSAGESGWTVLLTATISAQFLIPGATGSFAATWVTASGAYSAAIAAFQAVDLRTLPTLQALLGSFSPDDTVTFGGNHWTTSRLIHFLSVTGDSRAALKSVINGKSILVFNTDTSVNTSVLIHR
jgi:hypothetical protein